MHANDVFAVYLPVYLSTIYLFRWIAKDLEVELFLGTLECHGPWFMG